MFRLYMTYLHDNDYHVIAMRDLLAYIDLAHPPDDPLLKVHVSTDPKKWPDEFSFHFK